MIRPHGPLVARLRAWFRAYETHLGRRYPKTRAARALVYALSEEADALGQCLADRVSAFLVRARAHDNCARTSPLPARESDAAHGPRVTILGARVPA